jgi:DNA transformation protein and related proteins
MESVPKPSQFVQHVVETMRRFGPVEPKPMFGGWGLYHRGAFFALIADDALYLKTDDQSRPDFEAAGLAPFVYSMKTGEITMSYFQAPDEALEDPDVMAEWARRAYAAALRAQGAKKKGGVRKASPRGGVP